MRTLRVYSLTTFVRNTHVFIPFIMLYLAPLELIHHVTGSLYFLITFLCFPSPYPPPLGTTDLNSISMSLSDCV